MGWFSFTQEIAVDLGTANTIIIHNDRIVIDEPSVVALDSKTNKPIAVGERAREMHGKVHEGIRTVRPLSDGVIADFNAAEHMIRGMIKKVSAKNHWFSPSLRMVVCVPSGSTEVEIRAVRDSSEHAGGRDVYMIYEPMAAALGIGLDVLAPEGNMIVDIGGRTAEAIKINVGSALTDLGPDAPEDFIIHGPNQVNSLPLEVPVTYQEVCHCIEKSISKIEAAVLSALEQTPPELYQDIVHNGIFLTGGGALLRGLDRRLTDKIGIEFHVAEDPLHAVAKGTGIALKNIKHFKFLMR